jgi:hypothetical protein
MKKTLSILLVMIMMFSLSGITASAQEQEYYVGGRSVRGLTTEGLSGSAIFIDIQHGSAAFSSSGDNIYTITVSPDPGYRLESYDLISENIRDFKGSTVTCDVSVSGNDVVYLFTMLIDEETSYSLYAQWDYTQVFSRHQDYIDNLANTDYWESCLDWLFASNVVYTDAPSEPEPQPLPDLYAVRVESNPAGVATFSGYGTGFQDGDAYNVAIMSADPNYEFTGWTGAPSGNISGSDVNLVANFEQVVFEDEETPEALEVRYEVSAVSEPAGVGTFTGEGLFRSGDSFNVQVATVMEGYEFLRWETVNTGVVDGADVEVIAVFAEITEEPVDEVPAEEPVEEVLDEEIPEDVDTLPETAGVPFVIFGVIGAVISGGGLYIRKKK